MESIGSERPYSQGRPSNGGGAIQLVNQIRQRAFGDASHNVSGSLSGDALLDVIYKERQRELLFEGAVRWDMILSGKFTERTNAMRTQVKEMIAGLKANGFYTFTNGRTIPAYVWTKQVHLDNPLTFDAAPSDPALFPGWRGQYDYSQLAAVKAKVVGENHNVAIKGLFEYIAPGSAEATALEADGYVQTQWGVFYSDTHSITCVHFMTLVNIQIAKRGVRDAFLSFLLTTFLCPMVIFCGTIGRPNKKIPTFAATNTYLINTSFIIHP